MAKERGGPRPQGRYPEQGYFPLRRRTVLALPLTAEQLVILATLHALANYADGMPAAGLPRGTLRIGTRELAARASRPGAREITHKCLRGALATLERLGLVRVQTRQAGSEIEVLEYNGRQAQGAKRGGSERQPDLFEEGSESPIGTGRAHENGVLGHASGHTKGHTLCDVQDKENRGSVERDREERAHERARERAHENGFSGHTCKEEYITLLKKLIQKREGRPQGAPDRSLEENAKEEDSQVEEAAARGERIWEVARARLAREIDQANFETWIAPLRALGVDGNGLLYLEADSTFNRSWVLRNFRDAIVLACEGQALKVDLVVVADEYGEEGPAAQC